jgi:hypothetical protein
MERARRIAARAVRARERTEPHPLLGAESIAAIQAAHQASPHRDHEPWERFATATLDHPARIRDFVTHYFDLYPDRPGVVASNLAHWSKALGTEEIWDEAVSTEVQRRTQPSNGAGPDSSRSDAVSAEDGPAIRATAVDRSQIPAIVNALYGPERSEQILGRSSEQN